MKTVFLDTMIFLHYRPIEDIDWPQLVGDSEVRIVVPRITISELDKHKNSSLDRRQNVRARSEMSRLVRRFEQGLNEVRPGVTIELFMAHPKVDYEQLGLSPSSNDDVLIAAMLEYRATHQGSELVLFSQDGTPRIVANSLGLVARGLPDELRSSVDPDPVERERAQLRKRVEELENDLPGLSLRFANPEGEQNRIVVCRPRPLNLHLKEIERRVHRERARRQPIDPSKAIPTPPREPGPPRVLTREDFLNSIERPFVLTEDRRLSYNSDLENYFDKCAAFWKARWEFKNRLRRIVRLRLMLVNAGGAPAEDVDIYMHFPHGLSILNAEEEPSAPEPPTPPSPPGMSWAEAMRQGLAAPIKLHQPDLSSLIRPLSRPPNVSDLRIRKTRTYEVDLHVRRLKHKMMVPLPDVVIEFESFEKFRSFHVDYSLTAGNYPSEVTGELHVVIGPSVPESVPDRS